MGAYMISALLVCNSDGFVYKKDGFYDNGLMHFSKIENSQEMCKAITDFAPFEDTFPIRIFDKNGKLKENN
jgi:hypothetical protein